MSRSTSSALRTVSMFACIVLSAVMAHAQYRTSIQGVVTDTTGAVAHGAASFSKPATGRAKRISPVNFARASKSLRPAWAAAFAGC